jgi:hypothetical protein
MRRLLPGATERELDEMPWWRWRGYMEAFQESQGEVTPTATSGRQMPALAGLAASGFGTRTVRR